MPCGDYCEYCDVVCDCGCWGCLREEEVTHWLGRKSFLWFLVLRSPQSQSTPPHLIPPHPPAHPTPPHLTHPPHPTQYFNIEVSNNSFHDREEHKAIIKVGQIALEMLMDEKKADVIESISIGQSAAKIRAGLKGATGALSNRDPYMKNQNIKDAG